MSKQYTPRSDRTRWAKDQIVAALRVHGTMTAKELGVSIGCSHYLLHGPLYAMLRSRELAQLRMGNYGEVIWQLGDAAPVPVDVEQFESFPMDEWPTP